MPQVDRSRPIPGRLLPAMLSLVIPVYKNEENLPRLFGELDAFAAKLADDLEIVFVVDGSPDASLRDPAAPPRRLAASHATHRAQPQLRVIRRDRRRTAPWRRRLLRRPRGRSAGTAGAGAASSIAGSPPATWTWSSGTARGGPTAGGRRLASQSFWRLYRRFVVKDMPKGGIDVFGCTRQVRDRLLELTRGQHQPDRAAVLARLPPRLRPLRTPAACRGPQRLDARPEHRATRSTASSASPTCRFARCSSSAPFGTTAGGHRRGDGFRVLARSAASRCSAIRR